MRWTLTAVGLASIILGFVLCVEARNALAASLASERTNDPPSIRAVRDLAELTVLEMTTKEAASGTVSGHAGRTTAIVMVAGRITLAVDLEQARFVAVDQDSNHLILALPQPAIQSVAIDHRASRVLSCERHGLWALAIGKAHEDRAIAEAFMAGQNMLREVASANAYAHRARQHTEAVLGRFADETGWTLLVRWD